MRLRVFLVLFLLGPMLWAREKSKTSLPPAMQEQMTATELSLSGLEGFIRQVKNLPALAVNELQTEADASKAARREKVHRLSQDVRRELYRVIAMDVVHGIEGSLTAEEHEDVYHWAKKVERRRARAESSFENGPRIERQRIQIHIGEAYR